MKLGVDAVSRRAESGTWVNTDVVPSVVVWTQDSKRWDRTSICQTTEHLTHPIVRTLQSEKNLRSTVDVDHGTKDDCLETEPQLCM